MDDDPRYEVEDEELRSLLRIIASRIDAALQESKLGERVGFALILFEYAPGGSLFYISNAERKSMSRALRELLAREGWQ